jgi:hypothetical protein
LYTKNVDDDQVSGINRLDEDTMFHYLWKPDVLHVLLQHPK